MATTSFYDKAKVDTLLAAKQGTLPTTGTASDTYAINISGTATSATSATNATSATYATNATNATNAIIATSATYATNDAGGSNIASTYRTKVDNTCHQTTAARWIAHDVPSGVHLADQPYFMGGDFFWLASMESQPNVEFFVATAAETVTSLTFVCTQVEPFLQFSATRATAGNVATDGQTFVTEDCVPSLVAAKRDNTDNTCHATSAFGQWRATLPSGYAFGDDQPEFDSTTGKWTWYVTGSSVAADAESGASTASATSATFSFTDGEGNTVTFDAVRSAQPATSGHTFVTADYADKKVGSFAPVGGVTPTVTAGVADVSSLFSSDNRSLANTMNGGTNAILQAGSNITLTQDATTGKVTIAATGGGGGATIQYDSTTGRYYFETT